ncbi:MAG: hypothetical protein F6K14_03005 [Symploca sp. SIO2C1]|nr:hypothetical protein [Symploca sp. SIO2C1]
MSTKKNYESIITELVADDDDILGAVIISEECCPVTNYIGELNEDEILYIANMLLEFREKLVTGTSIKNTEQIWIEAKETFLIVVFYADDSLLLVKANKTKKLGMIRNAIGKTLRNIQSLVELQVASENGNQSYIKKPNKEEIIYRKHPQSPEY